MTYIISCFCDHVQLWLTAEGLATDIRSHAKEFESGFEARDVCAKQNGDKAWMGIQWFYQPSALGIAPSVVRSDVKP
jgi:hypothetical protein